MHLFSKMEMGCSSRVHITLPLLISILLAPPKGSPCEHHFNSATARAGQFFSPDHPEPYPKYSHCRYIFQGSPDDRVKIEFVEFDIEEGNDAGCLFDYIDIFTIDVKHMKHLEDRWCGNAIPGIFISVHQKVELVFKSDHHGKNQGFVGNYSFMDPRWQPFPPSSPGCGPEYITGVGGALTSPNYPEPYEPNTQCTWMIRVEDNQHIIMNFLDVDLGQSVHCSNTYLALTEGFASPLKDPAKKYCGQIHFYAASDKEFRTDTFRVVIRFVADRTKGNGFRLVWTAVRLPQYEEINGYLHELPCAEFHCLGGEYCIDTSNLLCNPLPRYCIAESLRCNGMPNCGAFDHSDEDGCVTKIVVVLMAVFGPLLLVLIVAAAIIMCRRKSFKSYKDKKAEKETQLQKLENSPSSKRLSVSSKGSPRLHQNGNAHAPQTRGNTLTLYDNHFTYSGEEEVDDYYDYQEPCYPRSLGPSPYHVRQYGSRSPHAQPRSQTLQYVKMPPAYRIVAAGVRTIGGFKKQTATV